MPTFTYKAIDQTGATVTGNIVAESLFAAQDQLGERDLIPVQVKEGAAAKSAKASLLYNLTTTVRQEELILFTKQIRSMLRAGISIVKVFDIISQQSENPLLRDTLAEMSKDVQDGSNLHDAFRKHPRVFPNLYCSLVHAGEASGNLPEILDRVVYIMEHEHKVKEDIKGALAYPKIVVIALVGAFFFLLTFVIPKFVTVFEKANLDLPLPTKICIAMYTGLTVYWPVLLGGSAALFFGLAAFLRTPGGTLLKDQLLLRMPIVGHLFLKTAMSRFASILTILLSSGVTILNSIIIISETIGNAAIIREFDRLRDRMTEGHGISAPLRTAKYFPPMVVNMVAIGEESGRLEEMLLEIAKHYDEEVEYAARGLSEAVGPILIVALTVVVGFFAMAIFLPIWDLTKMVK
ncbi:MAG: type II secretion system F family protein [Desulfobulbaceae bacterium]|nr:type II secretion system F family protein [Desulfobulbaceae bacterium]